MKTTIYRGFEIRTSESKQARSFFANRRRLSIWWEGTKVSSGHKSLVRAKEWIDTQVDGEVSYA